MSVKTLEGLYRFTREKYQYLVDKYNFSIVLDELEEYKGRWFRKLWFKNDICEIHFDYERGGYLRHIIKDGDEYFVPLLLAFLEKSGLDLGDEILKKQYDYNKIYSEEEEEEFLSADAEVLEKAMPVILEKFRDENYGEFKKQYEEYDKALTKKVDEFFQSLNEKKE